MPQPTSNTKTKRSYTLFNFILSILIIGGVGAAYVNRQYLLDWYKLRNYHPPIEIAQLATQDSMTDYGRKIFYVNHAALTDRTVFPKHCPNNGGEQSIVMGCYRSNQAGIYLLAVQDSRLAGVEQVTAAHEMLHGAYDRLNSDEKKRIDNMLLDYNDHYLKDKRIIATIAAYRKSEPHDVVNEMHSVFGTEILNLPAGLEAYYQKYFANRRAVAAYGARYESEFTSRQAIIADDDRKLDALKENINNIESDLKTKQADITSRQASLLSERSSYPEQYNNDVPGFNSLIDSYNSEVRTVRQLVLQYNQLVNARNNVALEQDHLVNELTTNTNTLSQ
ncbi:MAG: hypothetical protein NVS1B10_02640 [Candidatus Saccharimonadales bacterium]